MYRTIGDRITRMAAAMAATAVISSLIAVSPAIGSEGEGLTMADTAGDDFTMVDPVGDAATDGDQISAPEWVDLTSVGLHEEDALIVTFEMAGDVFDGLPDQAYLDLELLVDYDGDDIAELTVGAASDECFGWLATGVGTGENDPILEPPTVSGREVVVRVPLDMTQGLNESMRISASSFALVAHRDPAESDLLQVERWDDVAPDDGQWHRFGGAPVDEYPD